MKVVDSSNDTKAYGAVEDEKANRDCGNSNSTVRDVFSAFFPVVQVVLYPSAVLLASSLTAIINNQHHAFQHITAYIGWFFLARSIQGAPNPLALFNCSILILSSSYMDGEVSRERMTAIFVGSLMLFWLPQITRYQPKKGSLHNFLKSVGFFKRLCLIAAQLATGVLFIVPKALKLIMDDGSKFHFDVPGPIGVGSAMLILEGLSLIVVGLRQKKPILFVHDRWAFPLLVSSVIPPLSFMLSLVFFKKFTFTAPLDPRALQVFSVVWTLAVEVAVICFFWTNCCSWPWEDSVERPSSINAAATFGHELFIFNDICPGTLRRIPGKPGHYHASRINSENRVIGVSYTDAHTAILLFLSRVLLSVSVPAVHLLGLCPTAIPLIDVQVAHSLVVGYIGWCLIGYYMKKGHYSSAIVKASALVAWGSPFAGQICVERYCTIVCICNFLLCLPLFISTDIVDLRRKPYILSSYYPDPTVLGLIGGPIYLVAEGALLFVASFWTLPMAISFIDDTWDNYELQRCSTLLLIIMGIMAAIPLGTVYYNEGGIARELSLEMGLFGTILSITMRYLSTAEPLTLVFPPADSRTYQVGAAVVTLIVEVLIITAHSWHRRRLSPEDYLFSWWRTSSAKVPIESV